MKRSLAFAAFLALCAPLASHAGTTNTAPQDAQVRFADYAFAGPRFAQRP